MVVKSEIKEREIRTRSTTTTDPNLPDYLEPKPAPIVQDPEIATSRQVRMVRKLAKKLGLEWPTEADARAMSREQADASIQVLVEHEAGGGMTSAAAGLSGAVDALTRPAAPPQKAAPDQLQAPGPEGGTRRLVLRRLRHHAPQLHTRPWSGPITDRTERLTLEVTTATRRRVEALASLTGQRVDVLAWSPASNGSGTFGR